MTTTNAIPAGAYTLADSAALNDFIKKEQPTLKQCLRFVMDRGVKMTPAVIEHGIVGACELVAELGRDTDLGELVQGVTAAGEFTLKGEYKAVVEALDAIYCIAWNKGSDDTNALHILDSKGDRQMWWTVLEEAGADPYNPGLKGQEKAVAPLFQQVQD